MSSDELSSNNESINNKVYEQMAFKPKVLTSNDKDEEGKKEEYVNDSKSSNKPP